MDNWPKSFLLESADQHKAFCDRCEKDFDVVVVDTLDYLPT